jgi:integral membrane protein
MIKIFKVTAILEGFSYIFLLANMVINKHSNPELYKMLLFPIGMSHGILFIGYIYLTFILKDKQNWTFKDIAIIILGSLIPLGAFFIEKKYLKNA